MDQRAKASVSGRAGKAARNLSGGAGAAEMPPQDFQPRGAHQGQAHAVEVADSGSAWPAERVWWGAGRGQRKGNCKRRLLSEMGEGWKGLGDGGHGIF